MASATAEFSLVVAVCIVLLHSSLGQQALPPSPDCPYRGQQTTPPSPTPVAPAPSPTPTPTPMPSSPAPAPALANNCSYSDCAAQCDASCRAASSAGIANCPRSDHAAAFNACYESCTSQACPGNGKSCAHSGCGFGDCGSCHGNPNASICCEQCGNAVSSSPDPVYQQCQRGWERSAVYCAMGCKDSCSKRGCV